jgi:hypothetical protein
MRSTVVLDYLHQHSGTIIGPGHDIKYHDKYMKDHSDFTLCKSRLNPGSALLESYLGDLFARYFVRRVLGGIVFERAAKETLHPRGK